MKKKIKIKIIRSLILKRKSFKERKEELIEKWEIKIL